MATTNTTTINPYQAVKRMRELTAIGIPFSVEFIAYNSTKGVYGGTKTANKILLRQGLRNDQSNKANTLIAYTDYTAGDVPRFFNLPLLTKFNEYIVKP